MLFFNILCSLLPTLLKKFSQMAEVHLWLPSTQESLLFDKYLRHIIFLKFFFPSKAVPFWFSCREYWASSHYCILCYSLHSSLCALTDSNPQWTHSSHHHISTTFQSWTLTPQSSLPMSGNTNRRQLREEAAREIEKSCRSKWCQPQGPEGLYRTAMWANLKAPVLWKTSCIVVVPKKISSICHQ